jgi:catechol 2,3-dioxygenase-like lactoylglutathione lyase family enzyme
VDLDHLNLRVRDAAACRAFYERHFGFRWAFDADGGHFLRNDAGFLLAVVPVEPHQPLPPGFHIGFRQATPEDVVERHRVFGSGGVRVGGLEDARPDEDHLTFRCWDPDGTEIEVFWDGTP